MCIVYWPALPGDVQMHHLRFRDKQKNVISFPHISETLKYLVYSGSRRCFLSLPETGLVD